VGNTPGVTARNESLSKRVDELIAGGKGQPLRSTTGSTDALAELVGRVKGLEAAIREVAVAVEKRAEHGA
jgi:hypothetical protein